VDKARVVQVFAVFVTLTALSMVAVAAWARGGNTTERILIVALSIILSLGTHLLPALSKSKLTWILWAGCLIATVYGHLVFFTHSNQHAGEVRAQTGLQIDGVTRQIASIREALAEIQARPVATVASDLSIAKSSRLRTGLRVELEESKRSVRLHDDLIRLSSIKDSKEVMSTTDPVTSLLASVTSSNESNITLAISLGFSVLLELVGALLWFQVLVRPSRMESIPDASPEVDVDDPIANLKKAISTGRCKGTVSEIRVFLGCSQTKAMELRRAL
jgi:hypothetical protein